MPQSAATSLRSVPVASEPSTRRGMCDSLRPVAASISGDHLRLATSTHNVPAASEQSLAFSPVMSRRT